jgi:cyanophycinase-like exopeptidase
MAGPAAMLARSVTRLLTIMGSGETSPTMVKMHRQLLGRLGPAPVPAVLLSTPFGFQMNAADVAAKAVEYFRESVNAEIQVADIRSSAEVDTVRNETMLARLGDARYVFAGPGSPSYALRQWTGTVVPQLLADKLALGGAVTFASAAALTLGVATVPVYEIYKVGADPYWLEGLDLLAATGLRAAVIPHYNNAEGGNHDTRYCYLGEQRLAGMERQLPPAAFVLGVDEHTAVVIDLEAGDATVAGLGVLTVRAQGRSTEIPAGTTVTISEITDLASGRGARRGRQKAVRDGTEGDRAAPAGDAESRPAGSPLMDAVRAHQEAFATAVAERNVESAVRAILELDDELQAWSRDTLQSDELDRGRAALRSMVVRLGEVAEVGAREPREVIGPFVEAVVGMRSDARAEGRWRDADVARDRLAQLGVEVRDSANGTEWLMTGEPGRRPC